MSQVTNNTDDFNGNHTLPPSPATWTGGGGDGDSDEDLQAALHGLDVTVWLMILCIFTFFFIMVAATLCMTWIERRSIRRRKRKMVKRQILAQYKAERARDPPSYRAPHRQQQQQSPPPGHHHHHHQQRSPPPPPSAAYANQSFQASNPTIDRY